MASWLQQLFLACLDIIKQQNRIRGDASPQGDSGYRLSSAHGRCHAARGTPRRTPTCRRPWGWCIPPATTNRARPMRKQANQASAVNTDGNNPHENRKDGGASNRAGMPTLISRNGMSRLFSSLGSRSSSLAARRKLRLVAASAFMAAAPPPGSKEEKERSRLRRGRPAERARLCSSADRDTAGARDGSEIRGRAKNGNGKERARACRRRVSSAERGERGLGTEIGGASHGRY